MGSQLASITAVMALAASAAAQITSACNPLKEGVNACPVDPAFGSQKVTVDFTQGASDVFTEAAGSGVTYGSEGAVFTISSAGQAPSFTSNNYLFFGTVDVTMQVAAGQGIVTTFFLESDDQDEIDWEWLGGSDKNSFGQSNYFSSHDIAYGVNEVDLSVASPQTETHTYSIDWSPTELVWKVDGTALRTMPYAGNEDVYPQTPMQIKLGTWCGGCSSAEGTVEWAGGKPDWSQAPFVAYYKSVAIQDSSYGVADAVSYQYTDQSGTMKSIQVNTASGGSSTGGGSSSSNGGGDGSSSSSSASSSASTSTASTSTSSAASSATDSAIRSSTQSAATTLSTVTSASGTTGSASASGTTGATTTQAVSQTIGTAQATRPVQQTSDAASASSQTSAPVADNAGQKSAVNLALVGTLMFALLAL